MFLGAGVLCFAFILHSLLQGDPGNDLGGEWPWKVFWLLFPLPFIIPGAGVLAYAYRRRDTAGRSPERLKADAAPAEYPTLPTVSHAPGTELAVRLTPELAAGCGVAIMLGLFLLCSGITGTMATYAIRQLGNQRWDLAGVAGFFLLFLGVGLYWATTELVKDWRLWRLGPPVVELSGLPLQCGEEFGLLVTLPGPARLRRLRVFVLCEECVSYTEGTTTRKETRRVHDQELTRQNDLVIERWAPFRLRASARIPQRAMHSFKAEHNEVRWLLRIECEAERLFRFPFTHDHPLPVRPPL
jgi:hypothetical protein